MWGRLESAGPELLGDGGHREVALQAAVLGSWLQDLIRWLWSGSVLFQAMLRGSPWRPWPWHQSRQVHLRSVSKSGGISPKEDNSQRGQARLPEAASLLACLSVELACLNQTC